MDGLITIESRRSPKDALDRLEVELKARSITVFARIDHAAGAASVAMPLRPTEVLIFGSPKAGTPLMQSSQAIGIDLPLKMLAWQDADAKSWLTYNDPAWLAQRHRLGPGTDVNIDMLATLLANLARVAGG